MKKIINKVEDVVVEMCEGMAKAHPDKLKESQWMDTLFTTDIVKIVEKMSDVIIEK